MKAQVGRCGLCLQNKDLQESHFFPAALYKLSRDPSRGTDPNPVVVTRKRSRTTSDQVFRHFLCRDCEGRFSKKGEHPVLAQCARQNGSFRLRDLLESASPILSTNQYKVFDVQPLLGNNIENYLYFAASIFWRASACSWRMETDYVGKISLGTKYQEEFRHYLLGQKPFPPKARIFVHVSSENPPDLITVFPCTTRVGLARRHKFYIPGLLFTLFLGSDVPQRFDAWALNGTQRQLMWLCSWQDNALFLSSLNLVKGSKPSKKLKGRVSTRT